VIRWQEGQESSRARRKNMSRRTWLFRSPVIVGAAVLCLACLVVLPCTPLFEVRNGPDWVRSAVSLRQIGEALDGYHKTFGHLPPAVVTGKDRKPLYSWRVVLLPFLEQDSLFQKFKLDEPWDSPHNSKLAETTPRCYQPALGGDDPPGLTRYQVFVGPGTAFERPRLTWDDFSDGLSNTLLVVEAADPIPWSKPVDLTYHPDKPLPPLGGFSRKPVKFLCYEVGEREGFVACFADRKTRFITTRTSDSTLRALITRNGGETIDWARVE
jgi:hypothetical protein